jgi:hypothetical protein
MRALDSCSFLLGLFARCPGLAMAGWVSEGFLVIAFLFFLCYQRSFFQRRRWLLRVDVRLPDTNMAPADSTWESL